ncbi:hypothetical protein [Candidatus Nitrosocosmicus arcticus]|uniref:Uncharacterized protein n=1 Tax=Candidatus Nitrosocosmicus arcticus TaxID=2035267 RepID=A0A557SSC6_9ARCH|nr:hypothetical protein [Candidatus Nitrosocosmicus arcticus]TVP39513.1 hypothetical protein NARC_150107 [Candidatus Nitrosocosmicus arcticus]
MLKSPIYIKLKSLNDFARLVCSLERIPIPIYEYSYQNSEIFAAQLDTLNGHSITYYIDNIKSGENQYLSYKINNNNEEAAMVHSIKDTSALYSPIIKLSIPPQSFLKPAKIGVTTKYTGVGLRDLFSLSKLVAYHTIYEESTLPLFLFPKTGSNDSDLPDKESNMKYVLGSHLNLTDSSDTSYFYYVLLEQVIEKYFMKFSMQKSTAPSFSNHIDEHGSIYLKIIRLHDVHPLIKF